MLRIRGPVYVCYLYLPPGEMYVYAPVSRPLKRNSYDGLKAVGERQWVLLLLPHIYKPGFHSHKRKRSLIASIWNTVCHSLTNAALLVRRFSPKLVFSCHVYSPNGHIFNCLASSSVEFRLFNDITVGSPYSIPARVNILLSGCYHSMEKGAASYFAS
jgi:hypothetical protein